MLFGKAFTIGIVLVLCVSIFATVLRVPRLAFGAGATIHVDSSNTTAPWDGSADDPYRNITSALENAVHGDTIIVHGGTYTENVYVNKSVVLRGSDHPVIQAGGSVGVNVTAHDDFAHGVTVAGFNIVNATYGIRFTMMDIENLDGTHVTLGDFVFANNTISCTDASIHVTVEDVGYNMYGNASLTMGDLRITNNNIDSNGTGIYIEEFYDVGASMYDSSSVSVGNVVINSNTITSTLEGIYLDNLEDIGYGMDDEATFSMGNILVNNNIINSTDDYGIYANYFEYIGEDLDGQASFSMGNIEFNNNTIHSAYAGIYLYDFNEIGYDLYVSADFSMGSLRVNDNRIYSSDGEGIYLDYFTYWGYYLTGNSTFTMGNIEICRNTLTTAYDGIYIYEFYEFGYSLYDEATFTMGSFLVNENTIISDGYGMYIYEIEYFGESVEDAASYVMGNVEICRNNITCSSYGMNIGYFYDFGYNLYDTASFTMGSLLINENIINSGSDGIYIYELEYFSEDLHDDSTWNMESIEFSGNWIDSGGDGIYIERIEDFGDGLYNNSRATMIDFSINQNRITSDFDGIVVDYFEGFGTDVRDNASFTLGDFEIGYNDVYFCDAGMNFATLEGAAIVNNRIWNCSTGIQLTNSVDNRIYHNAFVNNTVHATASLAYANDWDNGYPSAGNFWGGYEDFDLYSGPGQNESNADGIWDHPYVINADNTDHYPIAEYEDHEPPEIGTPTRTPSGTVLPDEDVTISVNVTDSKSGVDYVTLYYTIDDGLNWNDTEMIANPVTDLYEGVIPGQPSGTTVRYWIEAYDYAGNNATLGTTEPYLVYNTVPELQPLAILPMLAGITLLIAAHQRKKRAKLGHT